MYIFFQCNCDINYNSLEYFRLLVTTNESLASLSWVQDSTLQAHITKMHTRKKQKNGGSFKWMRLVDHLTHQGLSVFQPIEHYTFLKTCKIIFEQICSGILS